jgi:hypothetical protein
MTLLQSKKKRKKIGNHNKCEMRAKKKNMEKQKGY